MIKFSVIIPVYNAGRTIERTLASFISNKDYIHEVILVDDGSTDNGFDKVDYFRYYFNIVTIKNIGNKGPGPARRIGIMNASADWITFVDADDCLVPTSLKYVSERIEKKKQTVLLHCQTIYYESGDFNPMTIGHSDISCGGNFYKREYLIEHNLLPHESLLMAEDEYFNGIVLGYIENVDKSKEDFIDHYDSPVYEVHHDISEGLSFALGNWEKYICKYHLLYKQYIVEFFEDRPEMQETLMIDYIENLIFGYFLLEGILMDDDIEVDYITCVKDYCKAVRFFESHFHMDKSYLIEYFYADELRRNGLLMSAWQSIGFPYEDYMSFDEFIDKLDYYGG
jgi:glycosyltransferase involved in cell wall biosynthesis